MTQQEARIFFPVHDGESVEDAYDRILFEHKQFFLTKAPIKKVFAARIKKIEQQEKSYGVLFGNLDTSRQRTLDSLPTMETDRVNSVKFQFPQIVRKAFNAYQGYIAKQKQKMHSARTFGELITSAEEMLELEYAYQQLWLTDVAIETKEEPIISQAPNPMEILQAIQQFENSGGKTFADIPKHKNNKVLLKEMKRLSLLHQKKKK